MSDPASMRAIVELSERQAEALERIADALGSERRLNEARAELEALRTEARRLVALVRRLPNTVDDYDLKRVWRGVERLDALLTPEVPREG